MSFKDISQIFDIFLRYILSIQHNITKKSLYVDFLSDLFNITTNKTIYIHKTDKHF